MSYLIVAGLFTLAAGLLMLAAFRAGYSLGWKERHDDMTLPRKILESVNRDIDGRETHHRHSALDPKKAVWH